MRYILTRGYIVKDVDKFPNGWEMMMKKRYLEEVGRCLISGTIIGGERGIIESSACSIFLASSDQRKKISQSMSKGTG